MIASTAKIDPAAASAATPTNETQAALAALERLAKSAAHVEADRKAVEATPDAPRTAGRETEAPLAAAQKARAAGKRVVGASAVGWIEGSAAAAAIMLAASLGFLFGPTLLGEDNAPDGASAHDRIVPWKPVAAPNGASAAQVERLARELAALSTALRHQTETSRQEIQSLRREIADAKAQAQAQIQAQAQAHAAQLKQDNVAALDKQVARIDRLERLMADPTPTDVARANGGTTKVFRAAPVPQGGYVLRRVVDGVAHLQSSAGMSQVAVGDVLPGAGRVRAIEKRDGRWLVFTKNGVIDERDY